MDKHSLTPSAVPHCFTSRLFVPTWWVRAFEIGHSSQAEGLNAVELAVETGLTPALGVDTLNGMSLLVAALQQQLLRGERTLTLDPEKHRKFVTSPAKLRAFSFERALHDLAALKLLYPEEKGFRTVPLFAEEHWRLNAKKQRVLVELSPTDHCAEVILGYAEPYHNIAKHARGEPQAKDILGARSPLAVWRSAWLDLQGVEQALLLRMEKAMQWDYRCLHLDGAFGMAHAELFADFDLPRGRPGREAEASPFKQRLRILQRLGAKLVDHGYLASSAAPQHLAFAKDDAIAPLSLVWQVPPERLLEEDRAEYLALCHGHLARERFAARFLETFRALSGPGLTDSLDRKWRELDAYFKETPDASGHEMPLAVVDGNLLVSHEGLFAEWILRSQAGHPMPLPDWIKDSAAGKLARKGAGSPWAEVFPQFVALLDEAPGLLAEVKRDEAATLAGQLARKDSALWPYLRTPRSGKASAATSAEPAASAPTPATAVPERSTTAVLAAAEAKARSESSRKRMVSEQLAAMKEGNPQAYEELKRMYLERLDGQRKKILMEVQDRLPRHMLDEQLRHSLIKFMMDNPGAWQGADKA